MVVAAAGMCFTWPTLEALVSEGESRAGVQHMVGIYNAVWAGTGAVAYFSGGAMLDQLGLRSLFYVPMALIITDLALTFWLADRAGRVRDRSGDLGLRQSDLNGTGNLLSSAPLAAESHPYSPARTRSFLLMAWLANPFAYIGINTLIAVMPGTAQRLELSTMWPGSGDRSGVLPELQRLSASTLARLALPFSLAAGRLSGPGIRFHHDSAAPNLLVLAAAQILFGGAIGLIYYSSLFYSMDRARPRASTAASTNRQLAWATSPVRR